MGRGAPRPADSWGLPGPGPGFPPTRLHHVPRAHPAPLAVIVCIGVKRPNLDSEYVSVDPLVPKAKQVMLKKPEKS